MSETFAKQGGGYKAGTMPRRTLSRSLTWLAPVAVLALLSHGVALHYMSWPSSPDQEEYLALGRGLDLNGELRLPTGEVAKRLPAYPAMLALCHRTFGEREYVGGARAVQFLLAVASTILLALIARRLWDARAGLFAGMIAAIYGPFLFLQSSILTETLLIFLLTAALGAYVKGIASGGVAAAACMCCTAVLLALAALVRANALVLVIPFAMDAAWRGGGPVRPGRAARSALRAGFLAAPAIVACLWWAERNRERIGAFTLSTTGGINFYLGHNADYAQSADLARADYGVFDRLRRETGESEAAVDRWLWEEGRRYLLSHPYESLVNAGRKLLVYHSRVVQPTAPTLSLIMVAGTLASGWRASRRADFTGLRRIVWLAALIGAVPLTIEWLRMIRATLRPWASPTEVLLYGLPALLLLTFWRGPSRLDRVCQTQAGAQSPPAWRGPSLWPMLLGLYATQLLMAVAFIPLARIRWAVDGLLILALSVAASHLCGWLGEQRRSEGERSASEEDAS